MNGAESLVAAARSGGVELCLANPGTTELPLVAALDALGGVRPVLCLFEGVCAGAADGYSRLAGRPALVLLHLGPGLAGAVANLHNARRARTPVLCAIGDHPAAHRALDPPLASDIEGLARPVSRFVRTSRDALSVAADTGEALAAAGEGGVAALVVPHDCQVGEGSAPGPPPAPARPRAVPSRRVDRAAGLLRGRGPRALFLGGAALHGPGLRAAGRIAARTGARLLCDTFPARVERGAGMPVVERLPYFPEQARELLRGVEGAVFAGTRPPVSFFGYPGVASVLSDGIPEQVALAAAEEDAAGALDALADAVGAPASLRAKGAAGAPPAPRSGDLTPERVAAVVAALQPDECVVMDESLTAGLPYFAAAASAPPHTYLALTGGAIGQGLPAATGAALARPGHRVLALQADGSGLYTLQALWTQAREGLDVVNVVFANRGYRILGLELERAGGAAPGAFAASLQEFDPAPDWVRLARGLGVPAVRVDDAGALARELGRALAEPGPHLLELALRV